MCNNLLNSTANNKSIHYFTAFTCLKKYDFPHNQFSSATPTAGRLHVYKKKFLSIPLDETLCGNNDK